MIPFHFYSADGYCLPFALTLQREGHPVTLYIKSPEARFVGKGLVPWAQEPPKGAVVVVDGTGLGTMGARYRAQGFPVIGGNPFDRVLEHKRAAGAQVMRQAGIKVPPSFPFTDVHTAVQFLHSQDGTWFVKVDGDVVESSTLEGSPETLIRYLHWFQGQGAVKGIELQRKVGGIEISCCGWFDGHRFVPPFEHTIENKYFLDGDLGPRTGCESCIVWYGTDAALAKKTVLKVEDRLRQEQFVGPIDLNSMVQPDGEPLGLEWSPRLGYDATMARLKLFKGDVGRQTEAFAHGELTAFEPAQSGFAGTLRLSIPPYPTWHKEILGNTRGLPLDPDLLDTVDGIDIMEEKNGPVSAGANGIVGTVSAVDENLDRLRGALRAMADQVTIPRKQHRTELFARAERDLRGLKQLHLAGAPEEYA